MPDSTPPPFKKNGPDTETKLFMERTSYRLDNLRDKYSTMRKTVYGNGSPGLNELVRQNQKDIAVLVVEIQEFHTWIRAVIIGTLKWGFGSAAAVLGLVVAWAISQGALT